MKKIMAILAALIAICSLSGCGDISSENSKSILSGTSSVEFESQIIESLVSSNSNNNSSSESRFDTSQAEKPPQRKNAIGKSDKDVEALTPSLTKAMPVNNDKTDNWRYAVFGKKNVDFSEYALSYYEKRFESDKEIHAVINNTDNTTTRISYTSNMLFVTVLEYVKGEESNAALMFSGKIIRDYIIYTDNGDIEDITEPENQSYQSNSSSTVSSSSTSIQSSTAVTSSSAVSQKDQSSSSTVHSVTTPKSSKESKSGSTSTLFPNYSKPEATTTYVLNTNTKKFHYRSCSEVKKIKPKNYSTISSRSAAISRGYSPCKRCNP